MHHGKPDRVIERSSAQDRTSFDQRKALCYFGGNIDLLRTIAGMFTNNRLELISSIERALESRDFASLAQTAHKLRGTLGFLAADDAFNAVSEFEESCLQSNDIRAQAAYRSLNRELSRLALDLNQI